MDLTASYAWIPPTATHKHLLGAWRRMIPLLPPATHTVFVAPLLKQDDAPPKSADSLHYIARGFQLNLGQAMAPRTLRFLGSGGAFAREFAHEQHTLVLMDDYVGTGDTAVAALGKLRSDSPGTATGTIILLALAAQSRAHALLAAHGCTLVVAQWRDRGISDSKTLQNIPGALEVMDRLGQRLQIKKKYRLGYGAAEALITLTRTPNNTFPVFWTNKNGWDPPFPR